MPEIYIGKYTLAVEGVSDLYSKMSKEWENQRDKSKRDLNATIPSKCNMQKAISACMTGKCVSLEALSILLRIGRKPALVSLAKGSGIHHVTHQVNNKVLFRYTLLILDTLEDALKMAKLFVDTANSNSSVLERCSYEATGLM
jgi:hypothetical protein